ncbi:MAG: hypothetical protein ABSB83_07900 [Methanomassiliicoccales archaeon]|jgi:sulfur carrier protein ThiS
MPKSISVIVVANGDLSRVSLDSGSAAADLLTILGLLPDAYIVVRGGLPIPITQVLRDHDRIRIIRVASGG